MKQWKNDRKSVFLALLICWVLLSLACSMPVNQPTGSGLAFPTREGTLTPSAELPATTATTPAADIATTQALDPTERAPSPTPPATLPIESEEESLVFAPTATPFSGSLPSLDDLTPTSEGLNLTYTIVWQFDQDQNFSIANVTLAVDGGEEPYTYFRDSVSYSTNEFSYRWGSCKDNPGTFRVVDADNNSAEIEYFETAPCP